MVDVEKFSTVPLFEGLDYKEITEFLKLAEDMTPKSGDEIVRQGDKGDGFYIISAGSYEVLKTGTDSKVIARLEELSFFGEMSLFIEETRQASVICVADGRLKRFSSDKFTELLKAGNLLAYKVVHNMCRILAQRLARVEDQMVS